MSLKLKVLEPLIPKLNERDQSFARSLCSQERPLSAKQEWWVDQLIARASDEGGPAKVASKTSVKSIIDLIERNNKAKWPKISVFANETILQVSRAGEKSRHPGTINVIELDEPFSKDGRFVGRIFLDGTFQPHHSLTAERRGEIIDGLIEMGNDPAGTAAAYGHKTGHCCFCRLALDDPKSLKVGYGPVCAKNYNLPWGAKA